MHKNATKFKKTLRKWCKNKYGASKIIDTFETYQSPQSISPPRLDLLWLDLAGVSAPLLSACCGISAASPVGWHVCNPDVFPRCGAVLGRLAVVMVLLRRCCIPLDDGVALPQPWLCQRCRRHGLLPAPLRAHL
jgi:hypothetical protein